MNKEIMLSIQPKHLVNILNGNKTLELRKTVPKDFVGWVNIYCTKSSGGRTDMKRPYLFRSSHDNEFLKECGADIYLISNLKPIRNILNGKVVARFWFDETYYITQAINVYGDKLNQISIYDNNTYGWKTPKEQQKILKQLCLTEQQVLDYGKGKELYAWHIKQLEIFDTPLRLNDFYKATLYASGQVIKEYEKQTNDFSYRLKKAPQNYQFVYRKGE